MFGPDLTHIRKKYSAEGILEQILYPSKVLDIKFQLVSIEMESGELFSGMILEEDEEMVVIVDIAGKSYQINKQLIVDRQAAGLSVMPEGLLEGKNTQELRDLLGYLCD
jgi:putative heme-binding domain-containing protein